MNKYKHANLRSPYLEIAGAVTLLALLSSSGSYALSFGVQSQPQQQSATTILASSDESMRTTSTGANTSDSIANETTTQADVPNATLVGFVSNIEQIRGHLDQALINKESGNNTLAQTHTLHPIEEVYSSIRDQLANQNNTLNQTLSAALENLSSSVTSAQLQDFASQIDYVNMLLNNSVQTLVPSSELNNNQVFNASVAGRLLHVAGHEYEEAVANGTVKEVAEYQDAQAFIHRAKSIFSSSASNINESMSHQVEEVNESFSNLSSAVNDKEDPDTVEVTINAIIHELAEIAGISETQLIGEETDAAEEHEPIAIINNIKSLLTQLLAAYRSQDYQGAGSIAIEAYLENYEYIEAPIAQRDQQLMEQTEVMLRVELRQMITDRVPIEQIEQHIAMVNANLDRATELLQ
jgi:hypothetical protein